MTGYHDPVTVRDLQEQLAVERAENGRLRAERDGLNHLLGIELHANEWLRGEYAKIKPIAEAAKAWRAGDAAKSLPGPDCGCGECKLAAAIDSALSASGEKEQG